MQNEERINCLETQVRTLKRIVYGFGCLLVAGIVVGATSLQFVPDVIYAKKFEVVNDEGKSVVLIGADEDGGVLGIFNKDLKLVTVIGTGKDADGVLDIRSKEGKKIASISVDNYGNGMFTIFNKNKNPIARIQTEADLCGHFRTFNNKGETTSSLPDETTPSLP